MIKRKNGASPETFASPFIRNLDDKTIMTVGEHEMLISRVIVQLSMCTPCKMEFLHVAICSNVRFYEFSKTHFNAFLLHHLISENIKCKRRRFNILGHSPMHQLVK